MNRNNGQVAAIFSPMQKATQQFEELFGTADGVKGFFCPGRVNLIGEHIDYLGGLVLPAAISLGITALIRPNSSKTIRLRSLDFTETIEFDLNSLPTTKQGNWSDHLLGVILHLRKDGLSVSGFEMLMESTLPKGSGLSSSAALEVLAYYSLSMTFGYSEPDRTQMALDCQRIENEFIGVNCGIMDQFAVANGKENHAIMLNCETLGFEHVPLDLGDYSLLIINSNKPRQLAESAYNQRRQECDEALQSIQQHHTISNLVETTEADLNLLADPILKKRTKHAFSEHQRVLASAKSLAAGHLTTFGKLMTASHKSLRDDYEVSCAELDFIVAHLLKEEPCLGARMTGAGFGGCCIALIKMEALKGVTNDLSNRYENIFGFAPSFYVSEPSSGVHVLLLD